MPEAPPAPLPGAVADHVRGGTWEPVARAGAPGTTVHRVVDAPSTPARPRRQGGPGRRGRRPPRRRARPPRLGPTHNSCRRPAAGGPRARRATWRPWCCRCSTAWTPPTRPTGSTWERWSAAWPRRCGVSTTCPWRPVPSTPASTAAWSSPQLAVEAGTVDRGHFDDLYRRYAARRALALVHELRPVGDEDLVVTHGDYTLPNVLLDQHGVTGIVDWGRAGVADRYVDLADVSRSLVRNLGPDTLGPFLDAYGLEQPDLARLDFYVLLAQLS
ncbi:MAG: phosphotransferase [Acidimicrobiia bacterium]|nr:phosphotransferase [Acidimicrobiia bacterium]